MGLSRSHISKIMKKALEQIEKELIDIEIIDKKTKNKIKCKNKNIQIK